MDWPVVAAAWVLLLCATSLLAGGALYGDTVALGGLRNALVAASAADRSIVVDTSGLPDASVTLDSAIRSSLQRVVDPTGGEVAEVVRSSAFASAGTPAGGNPVLTEFASYEGIERHASLVSGRWATTGASPQEATLSDAAAGILGLVTGDHITLVSRLQASLAIDVVVTGIWHPEPTDAYWLDPSLEVANHERGKAHTESHQTSA